MYLQQFHYDLKTGAVGLDTIGTLTYAWVYEYLFSNLREEYDMR